MTSFEKAYVTLIALAAVYVFIVWTRTLVRRRPRQRKKSATCYVCGGYCGQCGGVPQRPGFYD